VSGLSSKYSETIVDGNKPNTLAYYKKNEQIKYSAGYTFNKKFNSRNQLTTGFTADINQLKLRQDYIKDGDSVLINIGEQ